VVEVASERRNPIEPPSHAFPVLFYPAERRLRDNYERDVTLLQVDDDAVEIISPERAAFAARVPRIRSLNLSRAFGAMRR
jgi:hypothetical protein